MGEPFLAEIRIFPFNWPPKGWAFCNGQLLPINQNQALFALLGTTYGGNGQTTFALPNLQGRVPMSWTPTSNLGEQAGQNAHSLSINELPTHIHVVRASSANATTSLASNTTRYARAGQAAYGLPQSLVAMNSATVGTTGGSQPHENRQPFLTLNFCISLQGIFPSNTN